MHRIIPTCARRISLEESPTKLSKLNLGSYGHPDAYIVACTPLCTPTAVGRSTRRIGLMLNHIPGCTLQCGHASGCDMCAMLCRVSTAVPAGT